MAETEQPINQERENRIGRTVELIENAFLLRFTGVQPLNENWQKTTDLVQLMGVAASVDQDAAAVFVEKDKPEQQPEVRIPLEQLSEAYTRITSGEYDFEKRAYSFKVGGQQKTIAGERVFPLVDPVARWGMRKMMQGLTGGGK